MTPTNGLNLLFVSKFGSYLLSVVICEFCLIVISSEW